MVDRLTPFTSVNGTGFLNPVCFPSVKVEGEPGAVPPDDVEQLIPQLRAGIDVDPEAAEAPRRGQRTWPLPAPAVGAVGAGDMPAATSRRRR
jgi:hypothetical protein